MSKLETCAADSHVRRNREGDYEGVMRGGVDRVSPRPIDLLTELPGAMLFVFTPAPHSRTRMSHPPFGHFGKGSFLMPRGNGKHVTISGELAIQRHLEFCDFEVIERSCLSNAFALQGLLLRPAALGTEGQLREEPRRAREDPAQGIELRGPHGL